MFSVNTRRWVWVALFLAEATASCANVQCRLNTDCPAMEHCSLANTCVTDCLADRDCLDGQFCSVNGVCLSLQPLADGGSGFDAVSRSDARPTDAGTLDMGAVGMDVATIDTATDTVMDALPDIFTVPDATVDTPTVTDIRTADIPTGVDIPTVPVDVGADSGSPDATVDAGAVGVGVYAFTGIPAPAGMVAPVAVVWHPSGLYALILSESNTVYRYEVASRTVTPVAMAGADVSWRMGAFTPDGTSALVIGSSYVSGTSTSHGRLFVWYDATSTLIEQSAEIWTGGSYQSIRLSPDGTQAALLGQGNPTSASTFLWFVSLTGHRTSIAGARGEVPSTGCNDFAWTTDGFGAPALDVACGYNMGQIARVTHLGSAATFSVVASAGDTGNVNAIVGTRSGSLELAVSAAAQRIYRMRDGVWSAGFASPVVDYGAGVSFNDVGSRAFAFGGMGYLYEYRTDDYTPSGITVSQIPIAGTPWLQPSQATLRDVQWRPGCDDGLAVGGADTFASGPTAFIAWFSAMNGRVCP